MSVLCRPTAMPAWTADPGSVSDFGTEVLALSSVFDDCGGFAAGGARCSSWEGRAGEAYATGVGRVGRRADALSLASRDVATKVLAHADDLADLQARHVALAGRHDDLEALVIQAAMSGAVGGHFGLLGALDPTAVATLVAGYEKDRRRWIDDLSLSEQVVVRALGRVLDRGDVLRTYAGRTDPADDLARTVPAPGTPPRRVKSWWDGLTSAQQEALIAACPRLIGNLAGVPAWARSRSNTVSLDRDLAELGAIPASQRTAGERARYANALAADDARTYIETHAVDQRTGAAVVPQIYLYEPGAFGGDGAVAMSVGDLDAADNVAVTVPGFGTDGGSATYQAERAVDLQQAMQHADGAGRQAAMFWIGYDAPDNFPGSGEKGFDGAGVITEGMAATGGNRLADTLDGLDAMRGDPAHLTVIGHSYGSTTVGHALHDHHTGADDVVFAGSPGVGGDTRTAADLQVPAGHVWAGENSHDPITRLGDTGSVGLGSLGGGGLGRNPAEAGFGATRFQAESVSHGGGLFADHKKYFDPDTESLANMSRIATGDYGSVTTAAGVHDPGPNLGDVAHAAGKAVDVPGDLLGGLTHPWDVGHALESAGRDLAGGAADLGGPLDDPEAGRTATSPHTHD